MFLAVSESVSVSESSGSCGRRKTASQASLNLIGVWLLLYTVLAYMGNYNFYLYLLIQPCIPSIIFDKFYSAILKSLLYTVCVCMYCMCGHALIIESKMGVDFER